MSDDDFMCDDDDDYNLVCWNISKILIYTYNIYNFYIVKTNVLYSSYIENENNINN